MSVTILRLRQHLRNRCVAMIAAVATWAVPAPAASQIRYVNAGATGSQNGKSWANSYTSLQDALNEAADPKSNITQVWVARGTYMPDGGRVTASGTFVPGSGNKAVSFMMVSGVTLYGGFSGGETLLTQRNMLSNVVRLSGDLQRNDFPAFKNRTDNSEHVVQALGIAGGVLDGLTISGGETAGYGGGLYADNASLSVANCTLTDSRAGDPTGHGGGGALYASPTAVLTLDHCTIQDTLIVQGNALVENTNLSLRQARFDGTGTLLRNDFTLIETSPGLGGQFFVAPNLQVIENHFTSEGDRYLDLDPDPDNRNLFIQDNTIDVRVLPTDSAGPGTFLELRGLTYDCGPAGTLCPAGAFPVSPSSQGFTADPSENWVLESLEILGDDDGPANGIVAGRLTLTNRQGFQFQSDLGHAETVYVKVLKLHPYAVLNTAGERIHYQHLFLVDSTGAETEWTAGPPYPDEFSNHSSIIDRPLLSLSLVELGMDNASDLDTRITYRTTDPGDANDPPPAQPVYMGAITLTSVSPFGGLLQMSTNSGTPGTHSASSVAAKGVFARAGAGEKIGISFDYSFRPGCNPDAEIIVRLSQDQTVGAVGDLEVATIRPSPSGQPGAIGAGFATFDGKVPRGTLNFTHDTYVELELRGTDALVWLDHLNPVVRCRSTCGDLDGAPGVTAGDFLVLLASYGGQLSAGDSRSCLDSGVSKDYFVDMADLIGWSALKQLGITLCSASVPRRNMVMPTSSGQSVPPTALLVSGKQDMSQQDIADRIYPYRTDGSAAGPPLAPGGGGASISNGRLIRDKGGKVYQITATGVVSLADGGNVLTGGSAGFPAISPAVQVYVGASVDADLEMLGMPVADAVFHPADASTLYVVPVVVGVPAGSPVYYYRAAAKLTLTGGGGFTVAELYGADPFCDPAVQHDNPCGTVDPAASPYDVQHLREVEIDATGQYLFVTASNALNYLPGDNPPFANDWLLIYRLSDGHEERRPLVQLGIRSPAALHASVKGGQNYLYLASSINPDGQALCAGFGQSTCCNLASTLVYRLLFDPQQMNISSAGAVRVSQMEYITDMSEPSSGSSLVAVGFNAPDFAATAIYSGTGSIFTCPRFARLTSASDWTGATATPSAALTGHSLNLPLAVLSSDPVVADFDGDGHVSTSDLDIFRNCATRALVPYNPASLPAGCTATPDANGKIAPDFDKDGDVDLTDFSILQRCYSGPSATPDSKCAN